jgi:hypothetical protein
VVVDRDWRTRAQLQADGLDADSVCVGRAAGRHDDLVGDDRITLAQG